MVRIVDVRSYAETTVSISSVNAWYTLWLAAVEEKGWLYTGLSILSINHPLPIHLRAVATACQAQPVFGVVTERVLAVDGLPPPRSQRIWYRVYWSPLLLLPCVLVKPRPLLRAQSLSAVIRASIDSNVGPAKTRCVGGISGGKSTEVSGLVVPEAVLVLGVAILE